MSEHLNEWIDLIFGCKQQGQLAVDSYNVFIHLTYAGEVDIDKIDDPMLRASIISQIDNFGQTPLRLFSKAHVQRVIPDLIGLGDLNKGSASLETLVMKKRPSVLHGSVNTVAIHAATWHSHLQPPFCALGALYHTNLTCLSYEIVQYPSNCYNMIDLSVGDIQLYSKDKYIAVPSHCYLIPPNNSKYIKLSQRNGTGFTVQSSLIHQRYMKRGDFIFCMLFIVYTNVTCV